MEGDGLGEVKGGRDNSDLRGGGEGASAQSFKNTVYLKNLHFQGKTK